MARALVLGATGHIGAHIVRALLADGHEVRAAYRAPQFLSVLEGLAVERVRVDLDEPSSLRAALDGCAWVFHAAGYYPRFTAPRARAVVRGIESTRRLLAQIRAAHPQRVVFTSSASTIRQVPGRLANETDAEPWSPHLLHPPKADLRWWRRPAGQPQVGGWRSLYATVKIAMEQEALRAAEDGLPLVVVNPSVCIGEYDAHRFSGRAILAFAKHRLPFYLEHRLNAVYTGDVGVGHVRAAQRGRVGERYLLSAHNVTLKAFADVVSRAAGVPPPRWRVPRSVAVGVAAGSELVARLTRTEPLLPLQAIHPTRTSQQLDNAKALRELDLPQTPLEDAVRRAVAWFRQHGDLDRVV